MSYKSLFILLLACLMNIYEYSSAKEMYIQYISITGNQSLKREEILNTLKIEEKKTYSQEFIKEAVKRLENHYHNSGYSIAVIKSSLDLDNNLIIEISEGFIQDTLFQNLSYLEAYLFRQDFGRYENKIFYKPLVEEKLKSVGVFKKYNYYEYTFVPVDDKPGTYTLFLTPKKKSSVLNPTKELYEPRIDTFFSFRGWILSLIPYFWIDFYNWGGINHNLRLRVDWQFNTMLWKDLKFKESIDLQIYSANYFSPPFYKELRFNYYTGLSSIYRNGNYSFTGANFDRTIIPIEGGIGFDFAYFWTSLRTGVLLEKIHRITYPEDQLQAITNYPELTNAENRTYKVFSLNLFFLEDKRFLKEKDDKVKIDLRYLFDNQYSWFSAELDTQKVIIEKNNIFFARFRSIYMAGKYPIFAIRDFSDEYHMRGYVGLMTDRGADLTLESWPAVYKDIWHQIFFVDIGWYNNTHYTEDISTGEVGFSYGIGTSIAYNEMNLRVFYALPIKQRADRGTFSWFFRRRF